MYLIVVGDNTEFFVPQVDRRIWYLVAGVIMIPSTMVRNLSWLARLSALGIFASVLVVVMLLVLATFPTIANTPGSFAHPAPSLDVRWPTIVLSLGLIMVGFVAHPIFPTLYRGMATPQHYPMCLALSYVFILLFYGAIAVSGYVLFGNQTHQLITLNLGNHEVGQAATALFIVLPFTKFSLAMQPVSATVDQGLRTIIDESSTKYKVAQRVARLCQVFFTIGLACVIPNFATLLGFCGCLFSFTVSLTFPAACYLKLCWHRMSCVEATLNVMLVVFGIVWSVGGTFASFYINPDDARVK
eukprot:CAMPEP_0114546406 /NCGR_PEP_ID=MMETSP0114-20121206/3918_1 /TAXON_ID=31324 /ORGANISM="Goniomonas sp, Strain m" /LENGTH=299 /DNA_ID=CAMNT_0001730901 /DNA_START=377 /DNA_END=1276 /DNA_ORIENTATION=+